MPSWATTRVSRDCSAGATTADSARTVWAAGISCRGRKAPTHWRGRCRVGSGGARFVDASDVDEFFEGAVQLRLTTGACGSLLRPTENPGSIEAHGDSPPPGHIQRRLRRAWDLLSGRG